MVIFPVSATRPNILVDYSNKRKYFGNSSWSIDEVNPNNVVKQFSSLSVKEEYRLIAYMYLNSMGGNGFVYAIPKNDKISSLSECEIDYNLFLNPPRPKKALPSFMEAIDGDKSPFSYLQAAILYHDLCEFGASWHGVSWGREKLLPIYKPNEDEIKYKWEMLYEEPEVINPHFYYDELNNPVIVFYTINDVGTVTLNEYKHIFNRENYTLSVNLDVIGTAGAGIIF